MQILQSSASYQTEPKKFFLKIFQMHNLNSTPPVQLTLISICKIKINFHLNKLMNVCKSTRWSSSHNPALTYPQRTVKALNLPTSKQSIPKSTSTSINMQSKLPTWNPFKIGPTPPSPPIWPRSWTWPKDRSFCRIKINKIVTNPNMDGPLLQGSSDHPPTTKSSFRAVFVGP